MLCASQRLIRQPPLDSLPWEPRPRDLSRPLIPPIMIRPRALTRILPLPRHLRRPVVRWPRHISTPASSSASPPPATSEAGSPTPLPTRIIPLGSRLRPSLPIRRARQLALPACEHGELCLQPPQPLGVSAEHDSPPLDRLIRHSRFTAQRHAGFASSRAGVAVEDGGRHFVRGEQGFFVAVSQVGVDFVAAGQGGVDGSAYVLGIVSIVALVVVRVEGREGGEDGGFVGGSGAVGEEGIGGEAGVLPADVESGGVDGEVVEVVVVEDVSAGWG